MPSNIDLCARAKSEGIHLDEARRLPMQLSQTSGYRSRRSSSTASSRACRDGQSIRSIDRSGGGRVALVTAEIFARCRPAALSGEPKSDGKQRAYSHIRMCMARVHHHSSELVCAVRLHALKSIALDLVHFVGSSRPRGPNSRAARTQCHHARQSLLLWRDLHKSDGR